MVRYQTELAKLMIFNSQKSKSFVSCFVTQPKLEEERLGQIYIIGEIKKKNIIGISNLDCQKFIDVLLASIRNNYYHKNKNSPEFDKGSAVELLFEAALQKTNRDLQSYLLQGGKNTINNFLDNLSLLIGVAWRHQVHFALIGKIEVSLVRKNRISDILTASQDGARQNLERKTNQAKIFSHLISGNLETDDGLIFCTPSLLDYFSLEKIKRIVKENSANKTSQALTGLLAEIDEKAAIAAVIIKLATDPERTDKGRVLLKNYFQPSRKRPKFMKPERKNVQDSIAELLNRQEETNKIIRSSVTGAIKRVLAGVMGRGPKKKRMATQNLVRAIKTYKGGEETKTKHFPSKSQFWRKTKKSLGFLRLILRKITKGGPAQKIQGLEPQRPRLAKISGVNLGVLFICIIFGVLFIRSLFDLNKRNAKEKNYEIFKEKIQTMEQESEQANSRLIIGDKKLAINMYENILSSIQGLAVESNEQKQQVDILKKKIETKINETYKIKKVVLKELIDLGALSFFAAADPERIIRQGNKLYVTAENGELYLNNLETGEIKRIGKFELGKIKRVKQLADGALIIEYNSSLAMFDLDSGKTTPMTLEARNDLVITDFEIYNNQLYVLDAEKNLILKYTKSGNNFSRETSWLKDEVNIREGVELAIDGSIWVLTSGDKLINLMRGIGQDLSSEEIRPSLIRPSQIWTKAEVNNIYFIDKGSGRIIIMNKEGKIKQQYTSDKFENLKDFAVDEANEKIYVLDRMRIYEIKMD